MGAKHYAARCAALGLAALAFAPGCSGLKRLAPPGILKYEDLEAGQPPNPVIQERIAARRASVDQRFPNLSDQPSQRPEEMTEAARQATAAALAEARDALAEAVAQDRAASDAERSAPLDEAAAALAADVAREGEAARRERGRPMPRPQDQDQ